MYLICARSARRIALTRIRRNARRRPQKISPVSRSRTATVNES